MYKRIPHPWQRVAVSLVLGLVASGRCYAGAAIEYSGDLVDTKSPIASHAQVDFLFSLYDAKDGGNLLWQELQRAVVVERGKYSVVLGGQSPLDLTAGQYWLETAINGEILTPRSALPLGDAVRADCAVDGNLSVSGSTGIGISPSGANRLEVVGGVAVGTGYAGHFAAPDDGLIVQGKVGIGTNSPNAVTKVAVQQDAPDMIAVQAIANTGASSKALYGYSTDGTGVFAGSTTGTGVDAYSQSGFGVFSLSTNGWAGYFQGKTFVTKLGINEDTPVNTLDVLGNAAIGSQYSGNATAPTDGLLVQGRLGLGTASPQNALDVEGGAVLGAGYAGTDTAPANGLLVQGEVAVGTTSPQELLHVAGGARFGQAPAALTTTTFILNPGDTLIGVASTTGYPATGTLLIESEAMTYGSTSPTAFLGVTRGVLGTAAATHVIGSSVNVYLETLVATATKPLMVATGSGALGLGTVSPKSLLDVEGGAVVGATYSGTNAAPSNGLLVEGKLGLGTTTPQNKLDVEGGLAVGANYSGTSSAPANGLIVQGKVGLGTASVDAAFELLVEDGGSGTAIQGNSTKNDGNGIIGQANVGTNAYGVWGTSSTGFAGHFDGNVHVAGTLTKSAGAFQIDDPLDPANRYLYHSFVESPDMTNLYNGNAVLDDKGEATVTLPSWFEAVNRDFRYQLTAIGEPGPDLYIAKEISGNQFQIAGGMPGMKVSWMVTGIRHDAFANAHRIPVEVEKPPAERGYYLHPELFGQPEEKGVDWARKPEVMREMKEQRERETAHSP